MFRQLYESFTDPQQELNQNIARYQSVEPNFVVFNSQNGYSFPNAGITTNQQQSSNADLNAALNNLGTVPNFTAGNNKDTTITDLGAVFTGIPDDIGRNMQSCRQFSGLAGLSNMAATVGNAGSSERCGWRYKPGAGIIAEVAQGAYGNRSGPLDPAVPKKDSVGNGIKYYWNLQDAEKDMVKDICKAATTCQEMSVLPGSVAGDFKDVCGYCTTSKKIIPVKSVNGRLMPRYNDVDIQCGSENIISSADTARCPQPEPGAPEPTYWKCLNPGKLDRDCVTLSAVYAGCSPQGTFISALSQGDDVNDYANKLRQKKSFQVYQQLSQPVLSEDVIRSGNATLFASWLNTYTMNVNQYDQTNEKLRVAAQDLCTNAGLYESYNFCDELTDSSREYELDCMQKEFLRQGGTPQGTKYPKAKTDAAGLNWGQFKQSITTLVAESRSTDPDKQRNALNQLTGLGLQLTPTDLARAPENQGIEVFWFDYANLTLMGRRPTLSSTGSNLPFFNVGGGVVEDTNRYDLVGFMAFGDLRPASSRNIRFGVVTDDGYAVGINQDLFTNTDNSTKFSWWYDQGPTWHETPNILLNSDSSKKPNIMSIAWYENGGGAMSQSYFISDGVPNWTAIGDPNSPVNSTWADLCYLVQEINAPSLSFEVYVRNTQTVFCEKRLWSHYLPSVADSGVGMAKISAQDTDMPPGKSSMNLVNKKWATTNKIAYSAFSTITLCFAIDSVDGTRTLLTWGSLQIIATKASDTTTNISVRLPNGTTSSSTSIRNGRWHMATLVLNRISNFDKRINGYTFVVQSMANLKIGKVSDGVAVASAKVSGVLLNEYKTDVNASSQVILGSSNLSCRICWLHMFDREWRPTDIELFKTEANASWRGRWFQ